MNTVLTWNIMITCSNMSNIMANYSRLVVPNLFVIEYYLESSFSSCIPSDSREPQFDQISLFSILLQIDHASELKKLNLLRGLHFLNQQPMQNINLLTAHQKSCPGKARWFQPFNLMVIKAKNLGLHFHVERKISS